MHSQERKSNALFSRSFYIFFTRFFPSLANLLVMIWYSRYLPQADYGNYQHFWVHLFIIYPFICFGIHVLIITYPQNIIVDLYRRINKRYYALYFAWAIVFSILFALLQCNAIGISFVIPFLFILAYSLSFIVESFLIVSGMYKTLIVINVIYAAAFCGIHVYCLSHQFSLQALFGYLLMITLARLLAYAAISSAAVKKCNTEGSSVTTLGNLRSLWLHLGFYDIMQVLFSYIDKFIVSLVLTAPLSAVYYNGSQNIPFLPLLLSAAGSAVLIQMASNKSDDEKTDIIMLMNYTAKMLSCIVFPLFLFLLLFRNELIIQLLSVKYVAAIPVFLVATCVLPLKAYSFTTVLQRYHKGAIINIGAVADIVLACLLMYPLYQWLGLPGVALSFVITTYLQAGFYLIYSAKLLRVNPLKLLPFANWLFKLIVFAIVFIAIRYVCGIYFAPKNTLYLGMAIMVILIVVSLVIELKLQKHVNNA